MQSTSNSLGEKKKLSLSCSYSEAEYESIGRPNSLPLYWCSWTKASNLDNEQRQLLWTGMWAVLLVPAVRRAKNKRCSPGHPGTRLEHMADLTQQLPCTSAPLCPAWLPAHTNHPAWDSLSSARAHLSQGGPLSEIESPHFYTLNN